MMKNKVWEQIFAAAALALLLSGCGEKSPGTPRQTKTTVLEPICAGEVVYENNAASLDASRTEDGYFMTCYTGDAEKVKVQVTDPVGTVYTYALAPGDYETLPLTGGNGTYSVDVLENAYDNFYALAFSQEIQVEIADEFTPYLYPNQYVWYKPDSRVYELGVSLSSESQDDLDYVEHVYDYITENIEYDHELAKNVQIGYLPDLERVMKTQKGICFDYASLMTALLRSQGIPTRLVVGYSGEQYHAWIDVYLEDMGWVSNAIYFDGDSWSIMDPTLGATNKSSDVRRYMEEEGHYLAKYHY